MANTFFDRLRKTFQIQHFIYVFLGLIIACLTVLTIVYASLWRNARTSPNTVTIPYAVENGIIGFPIRLPNDGPYVEWTFVQMNDVYELIPLDQGRKGGLARVAYIRKLLKEENSNTYTMLAGDLLAPSAIGLSTVNGSMLNGKQMVATMNTLGLDFMTFGNHEFDVPETDLLNRMNESKFTWISTNVFHKNTNKIFGSAIPHKILTIDNVRILLLGLTIEGTGSYITYINQSSLVDYVQSYLKKLPDQSYDVLVLLTHLDLAIDIELTNKIPEIDLIMGGHEHENYYLARGMKYKPIYKADANAFTVFIHRCAFNRQTKRFRVYSTLARVTKDVPDEKNTADVANYWYELGIRGFQELGYQPNVTVSCLPGGVELDGRSESVRHFPTNLTILICESMLKLTESNRTVIAIINGGTVRVDDVLRSTITQYDILRTLPFGNIIVTLSVPGQLLAQVLTAGVSLKGNGMYLIATGVQTNDQGKTWLFNGIDISTSGLSYVVATTSYIRDNTQLNIGNVTTLYNTNVTQTRSFMDYLTVKYPPC